MDTLARMRNNLEPSSTFPCNQAVGDIVFLTAGDQYAIDRASAAIVGEVGWSRPRKIRTNVTEVALLKKKTSHTESTSSLPFACKWFSPCPSQRVPSLSPKRCCKSPRSIGVLRHGAVSIQEMSHCAVNCAAFAACLRSSPLLPTGGG